MKRTRQLRYLVERVKLWDSKVKYPKFCTRHREVWRCVLRKVRDDLKLQLRTVGSARISGMSYSEPSSDVFSIKYWLALPQIFVRSHSRGAIRLTIPVFVKCKKGVIVFVISVYEHREIIKKNSRVKIKGPDRQVFCQEIPYFTLAQIGAVSGVNRAEACIKGVLS